MCGDKATHRGYLSVKILTFALAAMIAVATAPAYAQSSPGLATVVSACGTPPSTYAANTNRPLTQNTSGQACSASTSTPSGTQSVTGTGTAGTPATGVVTVQGISGGTNLPVSQATASALNATVVGTGTFAAQVSGTGVTVGADGVSNTTTGLEAYTRASKFNGTTYDRDFTCASSATVSVTAGSTTQIIALSGTTVIRVCSFSVAMSAAGTASWETGTGTNCGTGTTALTGATPLATGTPWTYSNGQGSVFRSSAGGEICLAAVTGNVVGTINYAQF